MVAGPRKDKMKASKKATTIADAKSIWPKTVMGVKIKNQKEMDKLINSVRGVTPWSKGSLGS